MDESNAGAPSAGACTLRGRIVDSTYLGEMAQHLIDLGGGVRIKVFELHPAGAGERSGEVTLSVAESDVVVVAG